MKPSQLFLRPWVCLEGCSVHITGVSRAVLQQRWLGLSGDAPGSVLGCSVAELGLGALSY